MRYTLITFLLLAVVACGPSDKQEIDKAESAVMAVHDETMGQMGEMMKMQKLLRGRISQLDSLDGSPAELVRADEEQAQARQLNARLAEADSLMRNWMYRYNGDTLKQLTPADAKAYLAQEQTKINDVKSKINNSLSAAKSFLDL